MNRGVVFAVAGVAVLAGAWVLLGGSNEPGGKTTADSAAAAAGRSDSAFHAREGQAGANGNPAGSAKPAGAKADPSAAERAARLQPARPPGEAAGAAAGDAAQAIVEERAAPSEALAAGSDGGTRLAPKNKPPVGGGDSTDTQAGGAAAEPLPDVAYDSGLDKRFSTVSRTEVPDAGKIGGPTGAVSLWIKPQWGEGNQEDATFIELGDSSLHMTKNVNFMRFEYIDPDGTERGLGFPIGDWKDGDWHQVTGTWNNGRYYLYADGKLISENSFPKPPDFQEETKLYIGTQNANGVPGAQSEVSGVQVLNRWMSTSEIQKQFTSNTRPQN